MSEIQARFEMVLTKEEIDRIVLETGHITVDLHQLDAKRAKRLLSNVVALDRNDFCLSVIHGFNQGTVLKNMVRNDFDNERIISKSGRSYNPGITDIMVAAI